MAKEKVKILNEEEKQELMRNVLNANREDSYLPWQTCEGSDAKTTKKIIKIGLDQDATQCPCQVFWFVDGKDFTEGDTRDGSMEFDTDDVDDTSTTLKRQSIGQLGWTRTLNVVPKLNSKLVQFMAEIQIRDAVEGYEGALLQMYAQKGWHIEIQTLALDGSWSRTEVCMNVKCSNWIDVNWADDSVDDAKAELNFIIERMPKYILKGRPKNNGIPTSMKDVEFDLSNIKITSTKENDDSNSITVKDVTFKDEDSIGVDTFRITATDIESNTVIGFGDAKSGEDVVIKATSGVFEKNKKYLLEIGYLLGKGDKASYLHEIESVEYTYEGDNQPIQGGDITVNYINVDNNEVIDSEIKKGNINDTLTITPKEIEGYTLSANEDATKDVTFTDETQIVEFKMKKEEAPTV